MASSIELEFRILGEIEVHADGQRLDIGHARQCLVLLCLLVDVNRPVTADQLIDRVWADNPPHKARNALAAYISRLRQQLAVTDARITRGPAGYTLTADPASVDLHRFRQLVTTARASGAPLDASIAFTGALALWHGDPFTGIDSPWANGVRTALVAERLSVVLDTYDAAIAAGRHADVLAELTIAAGGQPMDERLAGQLMLAQFRCGRQADAMESCLRPVSPCLLGLLRCLAAPGASSAATPTSRAPRAPCERAR